MKRKTLILGSVAFTLIATICGFVYLGYIAPYHPIESKANKLAEVPLGSVFFSGREHASDVRYRHFKLNRGAHRVEFTGNMPETWFQDMLKQHPDWPVYASVPSADGGMAGILRYFTFGQGPLPERGSTVIISGGRMSLVFVHSDEYSRFWARISVSGSGD